MLAPTTATGLFRSVFVARGRETQSRAFFSEPGIEELYSGVAKRTASASPIALRSAATDIGATWTSSPLVVRGHRLHTLVEDEIDLRGEKLLRGAEELRVVRVGAKASRDRKNLHRAYASLTKKSSAESLTSSARAGFPSGSGTFQLTPNSVRSTVVSSFTESFSFPV